jgi:quinoprotein glucose dehydrogenase
MIKMKYFYKKRNIKIIISFILSIVILFYLLLNNNCLNLYKLTKSFIDFGYNNIKPCFITNKKVFVKQKLPKLFTFLSDVRRHYVSNYDKDLLFIDEIANYEEKEKELFSEIIKIKDTGIKGIYDKNLNLNTSNKQQVSNNSKNYSRQNKDNANSKFYNEINLKKINKDNQPSLAWKHISIKPNTKKNDWKITVETSPVYFNKKIFYITSDNRLIALNAFSGVQLWEKELLHYPSRRGFLIEKDISNNDFIYIGVGSNIYKINASDGKLDRKFGDKGHVKNAYTKFAPVMFKNNLIVVSNNNVKAYDKNTGHENFSINIFHNKKFLGALPWGGVALDEERGMIFFPTGNPTPKIAGSKRPGSNKGSNSLIAIDLNKKEITWQFKETHHDLWNLDMAYPPILTSINLNNKVFDVVVSLTKVGNFLMLERSSGQPIYDIDVVKVPKSIIPGQITSPYQIVVNKPEPITKFDWSLKDISQLKNNTTKKILDNLQDYEFGYYKPPYPNKAFIYKAEGPIWYGGALDENNQKLYQTVNQTPTIMRPHLKSLWPHSKIKKQFKDEFKIYKSKCSHCHGINRNGVYQLGKKPNNRNIETKIVPSLVGYHLFDELKNKINNFENYKKKHPISHVNINDFKKLNLLFEKWDNDLIKNKRIALRETSSYFVDEEKKFMTNYPHGEIVSYDLPTGKIDWRIPFGYENGKNVGTFIKGGLSLSNDGTLFATGTTDKKIYAFDTTNGKELWSYEMELSGNAPPILYEVNESKYLSVLSTGGFSFKYPDRGTILYTFKLN